MRSRRRSRPRCCSRMRRAGTSSSPPRPGRARPWPMLLRSPPHCSARRSGSGRPRSRWLSSSRRPGSWRSRCSGNWFGSTGPQRLGWRPASAAWISAVRHGPWPRAVISWWARPGACVIIWSGRLDTSKLIAVVLDEADEMLDLGFREDLEFILDAAPAERRTLLFSATIPRDIATLARRYQRDAVRIDTLVENEPHGDIEYRAIRCAPNEVELAVVNVLRFYESRGAMVFCHTREAVRHLHASLVERGFSAVGLSGELSQRERSHPPQALRVGRAHVCLATNEASRGMDLPDL